MTHGSRGSPRRVRERFASVFGGPPDGVAVAPGRVNLIGEHTDYNDGFVLPMGIERGLAVAFRRRADGVLRVHSLAREETREVTLAALAPVTQPDWIDYVAGVAWVLAGAGHPIGGADLAIGSDLPMGAGLSSSAALEVAVARALCAAYGIAWDADPVREALPARRERVRRHRLRRHGPVRVGRLARRPRAAARLPLARGAGGAAARARGGGGDGHRRAPRRSRPAPTTTAGRPASARSSCCGRSGRTCARCATSRPTCSQAERGRLDERTWKRAAHVVAENVRPLAAADALRHADVATAGALMNDSHASLRDLYEVSCEELDYMVERAVAQPGCHGARMTGAGFGGCAVALVDSAAGDAFARAVESEYRERYDLPAHCFACRPAEGAHLL